MAPRILPRCYCTFPHVVYDSSMMSATKTITVNAMGGSEAEAIKNAATTYVDQTPSVALINIIPGVSVVRDATGQAVSIHVEPVKWNDRITESI